MSDAALRALPSRRPVALAVRLWPWVAALVVSMALPWLFYDFQHGRHSGFMLSMFSQTGMMVIFALSFNMLMGQAGLLSFCHSVLFGLAGYSTVHFLNAAGAGELPVPMELMPLLAGFSGLGFGIVFGYMATKQRSTAFAMITLGIVQLVTTAATMFHHFFGGEGGVKDRPRDRHQPVRSGIRPVDPGVLPHRRVDDDLGRRHVLPYHDAARPHGERLPRQPRARAIRRLRPAHRPLPAVRGVRFLSPASAADCLPSPTRSSPSMPLPPPLAANALLMAYIGGATTFFGPVLGAILITLMQSGVSLMSNSWLVYVGVLFIAMVTFAPSGLTGIVMEHAPLARAGLLRRLAVPYLRVLPPGLIALAGFVGVVELLSFLTIGMAQGKRLELLGRPIDIFSAAPWIVSLACLLGGGVWLARKSRHFKRAWEGLMEVARR